MPSKRLVFSLVWNR